MASSVDQDQTAPCSGSTLFASILNLSVILDNYLQQTTFSDAFFSWRSGIILGWARYICGKTINVLQKWT